MVGVGVGRIGWLGMYIVIVIGYFFIWNISNFWWLGVMFGVGKSVVEWGVCVVVRWIYSVFVYWVICLDKWVYLVFIWIKNCVVGVV